MGEAIRRGLLFDEAMTLNDDCEANDKAGDYACGVQDSFEGR